MKVSVVVPTWRRPEDLARCLSGLAAQRRVPDEVVVVVRGDDEDTWGVVEEGRQPLAVRAVRVDAPGVVRSVNAGLAAAEGDLVAITDDDAVPRPDWLERMASHLDADPRLGGVGGRDWVHEGSVLLDDSRPTVGKVRWYGRVIGNHHLGVGDPREVDVLKGANMGWRRAALQGVRAEVGLRGSGMQLHWEIGLCLAVKRAGWKLLYDPAVAIDHYPAPRFDEQQRSGRALTALADELYNETYALLRWLPWWRKWTPFAYGLLVGTREAPGLVTGIERRVRGEPIGAKLVASTRARLDAARTFLRVTKSKEGRIGA